MKILLTSTSFQDTPGTHHDLLNSQGFEIEYLRGPVTKEVLLPIIANFDAVICGDDEYDGEVLTKGRNGKLKYIAKYGVGLDKIDLKIAKELGIYVTNCPGVNQNSVAEHVLALLFTFEKNIHIQCETTKQGSWKRMTGNEIEGKTIGIIGLGAIGRVLVKKCLALGMKVYGYDIHLDEDFLQLFPEMVFASSLDDLFENADVISLHVPHTPDTEGLINHDVIFNKLKKCPIIINTARGKLVEVDAIINGLEAKKIKGYLADVLHIEPISADEKLKGLDNVIITPHVGSRTYQSVIKQGTMAVMNLIKCINDDFDEK